MATPKVLVTGYGGFLGGAVVRQLLEAGFQVRGLARGDYPQWVALGVEPLRGDITDPALVRAAVAGCDAVVHTAALAGVWGPWSKYFSVNVQATQDLLEAARAAGCRALVHTSSPSVTFAASHQSGCDETAPYPQRWLCHYPHTKALAEQAVLRAGRDGTIRTCALRPHLIWGLGDPHLMPRVVQRTRQGRLRRVGSGTNLIDIVHVDNAARAHVLAVQQLLSGDDRICGEAFFITDGRPLECWKWITQILEAAGVPVPSRSISYPMAYRLGGILEMVYRLLGLQREPPMTRFVAAQLALDHYFSIDKGRRLLNYQPNPDIVQRLADCRSWLRSLNA